MSQLTNYQIEQHKGIYELFSYSIYRDEHIHIMEDMQYNERHNTYRIKLKSGSMLNNQIFRKVDKSEWEINYLLAEESINYETKPLPDIRINIIVGLKPKNGGQ